MKLLYVAIVASLFCLTVRAEDWTVNGKDYHNVQVGQVEADRVHITYDGGLGTVMLSDLTPELQKRFNYVPAQAKAVAQQRDADQAAAAQSYASVDQERAKLQAEQVKSEKATEAAAQLTKNAAPLVVKVTQVLPDGFLADKMKSVYIAPVTSSMGAIGGGGVAVGGGISYEESGTTIFIEMPASGLAEGQQVTMKVARNGTYTFTDTNGASRTVEKWTKVP